MKIGPMTAEETVTAHYDVKHDICALLKAGEKDA
jgi:hypothetical protein